MSNIQTQIFDSENDLMKKLMDGEFEYQLGNVTTKMNILAADEHSSNNVRVDAVVASMDEFYELYDVKEGDRMYVAPENRLKLW